MTRKKNNFNIANYIHLSYQGAIEDKIFNSKVVYNNVLNNIVKASQNSFKSKTGFSVKEFIDNAEKEFETTNAMVNIFSDEGIISNGSTSAYSEVWRKYGETIADSINRMGLDSQQKEALLNYTKASGSIVHISALLKLLTNKEYINDYKNLQNRLVSLTSDFEENLAEVYSKGKNREYWIANIANQLKKDLENMNMNLNSLKKEYDFGQTLDSSYDTVIKLIDQINKEYANGANSKKITSLGNQLRGILNKNIKGTGTETVSFVNLPVILENAGASVINYLHTGTQGKEITYSEKSGFIRKGAGYNTDIYNLNTTRDIKLADITVVIKKDKKIKNVAVSRKMRTSTAKHIQLGDMTVAQAKAQINSISTLRKYNYSVGTNAALFENMFNFLLTKTDLWYGVRQGKMYIKRKSNGVSLNSLPRVEQAFGSNLISSFYMVAYASFFFSNYAAFYDINGLIIPSPVLLQYTVEKIQSDATKTSASNLINLSSERSRYLEKIKEAGSGFKGLIAKNSRVLKNGEKYYPFELMAIKRNKVAKVSINELNIHIKSYNINSREYYNSLKHFK